MKFSTRGSGSCVPSSSLLRCSAIAASWRPPTQASRTCPTADVFFFQAEDGIRDLTVTGVQTCALPICSATGRHRRPTRRARSSRGISLRSRRLPPTLACELSPRIHEGSAMTKDRTILITGMTGHQGGAVAQALRGAGFHLRGLTRKPDSEHAAALARHGVDVVQGELDDEASLRRALSGAWGVFGVQNTWEAGVEREEAQGKRLATLAREAGVEHFVYSSVGSAHKRTGIPHFDNKWRIEETVRGLRFPSHVILRPVFFIENLMAPYSLQG